MKDSITRCHQAEAALRHSEARLQRIAASVPGVIYQFLRYPDGSVAFPFVSPSCHDIFEAEANQIQADASVLTSMIHPDDVENYNYSIALSSETLQPWSWEGRFILPSGRMIWVQATSVPERQVNGDILWDGLLMDITARKQAEKALCQVREELERRVEEELVKRNGCVNAVAPLAQQDALASKKLGIHTQRFLNSLLENLPVAVFVKDAEDLRFVFWNKMSTQLMGYSPQEVLGKSSYDLFSTEVADFFVAKDREVLASGQLLDIPEELVQTANRGQRILHTKKIPIFDEAGRPQYLLGIIEDITDRKQTEAALRQSQERLQTVMTAAPLILFSINAQGVFTLSEGRGLETIGFKPGQLVGSSIYDLYSDKPELIEYFNRALAGEQLENLVVNFAGIVFDNRYSIIRDEKGEVVSITGIALDITERHRAKKALQQSEQKFRSIVENANDIIYQVTPDGVFSYVSPNWVDILGHEVSEVEGQIFTLFVHPDDLALCLGSLRRAIKTGQKQSGVEYRVKHKDGTWRWHTSNLAVLKDASGSVVSLVGIARDISDRKQAEEALRESEERFRNLVETTNDWIWEVDENAIYTYVSPQIRDILGYEVEEVLGKTPFDFMPPEEAYRVTEITSNQVALRRPLTNLENINLHKDGHLVVLETSGVPFFDKAGNFQGYRGIDRDITKRKQTEEAIRQSKAKLQQQATQLEQALRQLKNTQAQLIQTEKMSSLGQLVAGVAHEINNPVSFIYGNINHAKRYSTDLLKLIDLYQETYPQSSPELEAEIAEIDLDFVKEDFPRLLTSMEVGAQRIREIVGSLRNFSRFDEATLKQVDIHQGLDSTLMLLQSRLTQHLIPAAIQVVKEYGNLPLVECYPGHLNQVFMNLLTNAIDALDDANSRKNPLDVEANPSVIKICTETTQESTSNPQVVIRIADNGVGMTEMVRLRAFDPFFTTKPVGSGSGLGLTISYQIVVELHKGQLQCNSSVGTGTEFVIKIPIRQL